MTSDLELAKTRFREEGYALVIAKDNKIIFESRSRGVSGFLEAIKKFDERLEGASVSDKITGRAVAFLLLFSHIRAVYSETLSLSAQTLLKNNNILSESEEVVNEILNSDRTDVCPFEKLVKNVKSAATAYKRLELACSTAMKRRSRG